jgi:hypothetical protein
MGPTLKIVIVGENPICAAILEYGLREAASRWWCGLRRSPINWRAALDAVGFHAGARLDLKSSARLRRV